MIITNSIGKHNVHIGNFSFEGPARQCRDNSRSCGRLAGWCNSRNRVQRGWMSRHCQQTCRLCQCRDNSRICGRFAGICNSRNKRQRSWMRKNCRKTCRTCGRTSKWNEFEKWFRLCSDFFIYICDYKSTNSWLGKKDYSLEWPTYQDKRVDGPNISVSWTGTKLGP